MSIIYRDINILTQKASLAGTEKFPVSDTEYVTAAQLAEYGGAPDISSSIYPNATPTGGANVENLADVQLVSELSIDSNKFEIEEYTPSNIWLLTRGQYGMSDETGTYMSSQSSHRHVLIYMEEGDYIQITPKDGYNSWFSFCSNFNLPVADGPIPFAGNSFVNRIEIGETKIYRAPHGTVCVRVMLGTESSSGSGVWSLVPNSIKIYRDKERLKEELVKGNGRREVITGSINYFNNTNYNNGFCFRIRKGYNYCFNVEMTNNGTGITKALGLCRNIPGNMGYNIYTWTPTTTATVSTGSNHLSFENWGNWTEENAEKIVEQDNTWGFMVVTSASANNTFSSIKVYEIDPYSSYGSNTRIMDPTLKGIAKNQSYTKINIDAATKYNYQIGAPLDQYGTGSTSTQRRLMIPVTPGQFVRVVYDTENSSRSVRQFGWYTQLDTPSGGGRPPLVDGTGSFTSYSVETPYDNGDEFYMQAPAGAKYLSVYIGTTSTETWTYAPTYIGVSASSGGGGTASSSDERADANIARTAQRFDTQGQILGLTPITARSLDSNGWEIPQTIQQLNTVKKSLQCANITWTPKATIPGKNSDFASGTTYTGVPYSSNSEFCKNVGCEVSLNTFMTAVNNPYSLIYTENIGDSSSASAWGVTYHSSNGKTYYGSVCCSFSAFANGQPTTYNNPDIPRAAEMYNIFVPLWNKYDVDSYQIGDVGDNWNHSFVIFGIKRNSSGSVTNIRISEATSSGSLQRTRFRDFTKSEFITYLDSNATYPFIMYRIVNYFRNIEYTPCKYFPLTEYGEPAASSYNNEICCFAGDEATFMEGELVVINYNLTSSPAHTWTAIEVYKDNVAYNTYQLSSIDQSALPNSQKNHALKLGTSLPAGMYKARMTDGTNYSDYTYWEVLEDTLTAVDNGDGSWTFSADSSVPMHFIWIGTMRWDFWVQRFARELDWLEKQNNSVTLYIDKTLKDWGREDPELDGTYVRVLFKGTYGCAQKTMAIPGRV